jgi:hypothetical protein
MAMTIGYNSIRRMLAGRVRLQIFLMLLPSYFYFTVRNRGLSRQERRFSKQRVTVGTSFAGCPPYRSVRAELPHTAPALSSGVKANARVWMRYTRTG